MGRTNSYILKLSIAITFLVLLGCETDRIVFDGPYFVRFTDTSLTTKESVSTPIKIQVHLAGPARSEDIKVNYKVTGNARVGIDYTIVSDVSTVTIKKGEYFGYITVQLINNSNNILRTQNLVFTLLTITPASVQVGQGPSAIGNTFTLTIQDDCLLSGTYSGTKNVFDIPVDNIKVTSTDCENYTLSNWNLDIDIVSQVSPPYDMSLTFVDNGDNTITVPEQEARDLPDEYATIKGTGVVNLETNQIIITLTLIDLDDTVVTLTFNRD